MAKTFREKSRTDYNNGTDAVSGEDIQIGCLQRIADATELMAKNYTKLQADLDMYKKWYNESDENRWALERKISSLRGVITKLKNKALQEAEKEGNHGQ